VTIRVGINGSAASGELLAGGARRSARATVPSRSRSSPRRPDRHRTWPLLKTDKVLAPGPGREHDGDAGTWWETRSRRAGRAGPGRAALARLGLVDVVIESTGRSPRPAEARTHLRLARRRSSISRPPPTEDITIVMGVNEGPTTPPSTNHLETRSAPRNCVAPMAKVLQDPRRVKGPEDTITPTPNDQ